jgi:hypothetical protein
MSTKRSITVLKPPVKRQTTINAEMRGRLTMFSECVLSHINEESEEEGIWLEGVKHKSVEIIRTGDIILLPNGDPGRNKMVNLEFLMSVSCYAMDITAISESDDMFSISLEVIGLLNEEDSQIFQNGQRLFVEVEAEKKLLVVIANSDFAQCFGHLGSLVPKKRRLESAAIKVPSSSRESMRIEESIGSGEVNLRTEEVESLSTSVIVASSSTGAALASADESQKIGKKFYDLDGRGWQPLRSILFTKEIGEILGLLRLMDSERIKSLLSDLKFSMEVWLERLSVCSMERVTETSSLRSASSLPLTQSLVVHKDRTLLELFLKSDFSPYDWTKLTLSVFLFEEDHLRCFDSPSVNGRRKIMEALENVQLMCSIHFHPVFYDVLGPMVALFKTNHSALRSYHDIYLKCRIDFLLYNVFHDIKNLEKSHHFPEQRMSSPAECYDLIRLYANEFVEDITKLHSTLIQPHFSWYGQEGQSVYVKLDQLTYQGLNGYNKKHFPLSVPKVTGKGVSGGQRREGQSAQRSAFVCVWHVAEQLKLSLPRGPVKCTKGCSSHVPLKEISFGVLMRVMESIQIAEATRVAFSEAFAKNKARFGA